MIEFLERLSKAYYEGRPFITDTEFDALSARYNYNKIGHTITDGIKHYIPMSSLQKVFDLEDAPFSLNGAIASPKLDGAAVSLLYVGGKLELALTRGDGKVGRDITAKMRRLVPNEIPLDGVRQITGEVVSPSSIPNSRNYASGALNTKSMTEFAQKEVQFVAYDVQPGSCTLWHNNMDVLNNAGFQVITKFDATNYPTDGVVYRIDCVDFYEKQGYTSHHPRGAFALKEQKDGVPTKLLDVVWQVGKSGVVSPVAILDPVLIGDATIAKATLHNIEYIRGLGLEIGCTVEVIRSGEIIPRILRRIDQ